MRVLIVEDDAVTSKALGARLQARIPDCEITFATSHIEATSAIQNGTFDAAVLDLRLPSDANSGNPTIEYGLEVESLLAHEQPGALRVFLTASEAAVVLQAIQQCETKDFFFCNEVFPIVDYVRKEGAESLDHCVDRLCVHRERLDSLDAVHLEGDDGFEVDARRALAITVRVAGGSSGRVLKTAGFSTCVTALVECVDENGGSVGNAFCKSGPASEIERERQGYQLAEFQLPSTSRPSLARSLAVGAGRSRALIFTEAPTAVSFFDRTSADPDACAGVVAKLPEVMKTWSAVATRDLLSLHALATEVISEAARLRFHDQISALHLDDLAGREAELITHCQHGDLHGSNLFITSAGEPFLIDFAHTRVQPGPVDPVSLELSLIFHPSSPVKDMLLDVDGTGWFDLDYVSDLPGGPIIGACRSWTTDAGHDDVAHAAATLCYSLWILNHATHPEIALRLAEAACNRLRS